MPQAGWDALSHAGKYRIQPYNADLGELDARAVYWIKRVFRVGKVATGLFATVDDVLGNPNLLRGLKPADVLKKARGKVSPGVAVRSPERGLTKGKDGCCESTRREVLHRLLLSPHQNGRGHWVYSFAKDERA